VPCGVYEIKNTVTGDRYVGSSVTIKSRLYDHQMRLRAGIHRNEILQDAWDRWGEHVFKCRQIVECAPSQVVEYEQRCIVGYAPNLYNKAMRATGPGEGGRKKISAARQKLELFNGELVPRKKIAEALGITTQALYHRVKQGLPLEEASLLKHAAAKGKATKRNTAATHTLHERPISLAELAEMKGMSKTGMAGRLERMSPEDAIAEPLLSKADLNRAKLAKINGKR
jgi:group I intron endonuclease